jgi:phosphatidylinositol 3-kinase
MCFLTFDNSFRKLCSEMVAAMGGETSKDFELFKQLCVEAYNILRKNANLILNLLSLMADANIPDIGNERTLLQVKLKLLASVCPRLSN